ncbi:hypothetical protein [Legionella sp. CNM-4043-24]|uniref:hypothetical protein n=1 Tax=Legionella sp. CNM-4043-24 TaxID=3421646 RepID=UPI00403B0A8F
MKVKILDHENNTLWKKTLDRPEYDDLKTFCNRTGPDVPGWQMLIIPTRTDSMKHAAMDCLSPLIINTLYYEGWPSDRTFRQNLEFIPAFFLELLTLPVRLITLIPRALYNLTQPVHPLRVWLRAENVPEEYVRGESIKMLLQSDIKGEECNTKIDFSEERNCRIDTMTTRFYKKERPFNVNFSKPCFLFRPGENSRRNYTGEEETREVIIPFANQP